MPIWFAPVRRTTHRTFHRLDPCRQMQAHIYRRSYRHGPGRLYQHALHAHIHRLAVDLLFAHSPLNPRSQRHPSGPPPLVFDRSLRGADQLHQSLFVDRLVQEETRSCFKSPRHCIRPLVVAEQHHRRHAVVAGLPRLPRQLCSIGKRHVEIQEDDCEFTLPQDASRLGALRQHQRLNAHGSQNLLDQLAGCRLVVDNQSSLLHQAARFPSYLHSLRVEISVLLISCPAVSIGAISHCRRTSAPW